MCTLDWQETQCSLQQPPLRDKSCPWDSPIGLLNSQASCESSAAPQKQFISLRLKASHNTPVDSSILCQSKPIFLLVSSAPPSPNICSIFLHYKHRRDWPDKSKGWGKRQELSSDLNTEIFRALSGILELSKPCQDLVLFGSCFAAGPQNISILSKQRKKIPQIPVPHFPKPTMYSFSFNKTSSL